MKEPNPLLSEANEMLLEALSTWRPDCINLGESVTGSTIWYSIEMNFTIVDDGELFWASYGTESDKQLGDRKWCRGKSIIEAIELYLVTYETEGEIE